MQMTLKDVAMLRDRIHNLDMQNALHVRIYQTYRLHFIMDVEGVRDWAYDDKTGQRVQTGKPVKGSVTVGVGFNMSRGKNDKDARKEWDEAFHGTVSFDAVKSGRKRLTKAQVQRLLRVSLDKRVFTYLRKTYDDLEWK